MNEQNQSNATNLEPHVLEQGDIYFFYRPKEDVQGVKGGRGCQMILYGYAFNVCAYNGSCFYFHIQSIKFCAAVKSK
jgi:hypothetical protein